MIEHEVDKYRARILSDIEGVRMKYKNEGVPAEALAVLTSSALAELNVGTLGALKCAKMLRDQADMIENGFRVANETTH